MAGLKDPSKILNSIKQQTLELRQASTKIVSLMEAEEHRLHKQDQVLQLQSLCQSISSQIEKAEETENQAALSASKTHLGLAVGGLIAGTFLALISSKTGANVLQSTSNIELPPFGRIMVAIGLHGIPDDIQVVVISLLAREAAVSEEVIISRLQTEAKLLLTEDQFTSLIQQVISIILKGNQPLPLSLEKLRNMKITPQNNQGITLRESLPQDQARSGSIRLLRLD